MRPFLTVWTIVGLLLAFASNSTAGDTGLNRDTLRGITSVPVLIQLDPDASSHGLTSDQLQTDVELRLRKAGLPVPNALGSGPYLYVEVGLMKGTGELNGAYVVYYEVSFFQPAFVIPTSVTSVVPTWSYSRLGVVGGDNLATTSRSTIADLVDKFINAYLSVNPKK